MNKPIYSSEKKQRLRLPQTEVLFVPDRTFVWDQYRLYWDGS